MSEEKTEAPTAKKKKESRKEGQVPRTQELGGWSTLLAFGMLLDFAAGRELTLDEGADGPVRSGSVEDPDQDKALALLGDGLMHVLVVLVVARQRRHAHRRRWPRWPRAGSTWPPSRSSRS